MSGKRTTVRAGIMLTAATAVMLAVGYSLFLAASDDSESGNYSDVETYAAHLAVRGVTDPEAKGGFRVCDTIESDPDVSYPTLLAVTGQQNLPASAVVVDAALTHLCPWLGE